VWRQVLAAYAAGVALNGVLPAGTGSVVTLLMFVAMIPGATFAGVLGGLAVQKIFFALASAFVYVYLFATVPGTFRRQLRVPHDHPALTVLIAIGAAVLIVVLARILWHKLAGVLEKAKEGGAILGRPGHYLIAVVLPSFGAWMAKLAVTAVFLAAFGITVTRSTPSWRCSAAMHSPALSQSRRRRGRQPGHQHRSPQRRHRICHRDRLLTRPTARHHGVQHRLRGHPRRLGVRLERRQGPVRAIPRHRQDQARRGPDCPRRRTAQADGPTDSALGR
jgi:hypothetical protein